MTLSQYPITTLLMHEPLSKWNNVKTLITCIFLDTYRWLTKLDYTLHSRIAFEIAQIAIWICIRSCKGFLLLLQTAMWKCGCLQTGLKFTVFPFTGIIHKRTNSWIIKTTMCLYTHMHTTTTSCQFFLLHLHVGKLGDFLWAKVISRILKQLILWTLRFPVHQLNAY